MPLGDLSLLPQAKRLQREPFPSETQFFRQNPNVSGMATEDGRIILSPISTLSEDEQSSVLINEAARLKMRELGLRPNFTLTEKQKQAFQFYGSPQDVRETIVARIISGDPSALDVTDEQKAFAESLRRGFK